MACQCDLIAKYNRVKQKYKDAKSDLRFAQIYAETLDRKYATILEDCAATFDIAESLDLLTVMPDLTTEGKGLIENAMSVLDGKISDIDYKLWDLNDEDTRFHEQEAAAASIEYLQTGGKTN